MENKKHGGKRIGSGQKGFSVPSKVLSITVPEESIPTIKLAVKKITDPFKVKKAKKLVKKKKL